MKAVWVLVPLPFILGACWAIDDVSANNEIESSLPFHASVSCGPISALTPQAYLLSENKGGTLILRQAASKNFYSASIGTAEEFVNKIKAARREANGVDTFPISVSDRSIDVFSVQRNEGDKVSLEFTAYLSGASRGIIATETSYYFPSAMGSATWGKRVPIFFSNFLESLIASNQPNHVPEPSLSSGTPPARQESRLR